MGFRIFMLIMDLLIPLTLIGFGRYFMRTAPNNINSVFGYRTGMSMKTRDTWEFAHKYCGRLWFISGLILLPVSLIAMLAAFGKTENTVGTIGAVLCFVQMIPLVGSIFPTERALKRTFDENGNRRQD